MFYKYYLLMKKETLLFARSLLLLATVFYFSTYDVYQAASTGTDPNYFPLAIHDLDHSQAVRQIVDLFRAPYFEVRTYIQDDKEIQKLIESDQVYAVLTFPQGFARDLAAGRTADIQVILDGTNSNASEIALDYIEAILAEYNNGLLTARLRAYGAGQRLPLIDVRTYFIGNTALNEYYTFGLQEFFTVLTLLGLLLTATAIVNEKQFGTIEQLMVSPLRTLEIILPKVLTMIGVLMLVLFLCLWIPFNALGVPLAGSLQDLVIATLLYVFTLTGYGLLIATLSNNLSETILISLLVILPILFLSGLYVPIESLAPWLRPLIGFSPLKYYLNLGNGIFLKGNPLLLMWPDVVSLLVLGVASFSLGLWRFRKSFSE